MNVSSKTLVRRFGPFTVTDRPLRLEREGAAIGLRHQAMKLLVLFVERPGELVTHEEIRARLWADRHVDFMRGIHLLVREIRVALGDDADAPTFIETLPRQGYRFIAEVERFPTATTPIKTGREPLRAALFAARGWAAAGVVSVAVAALAFATLPDLNKVGATAPSQAREAYLKGEYLLDKGGRENLDKSAAYFADALALDATFAEAHAGLAEVALMQGDYDRAESEAKNALAAEPSLAAAHMHLGMVAALRDWNWREAARLIDRALKLNPHSAKAYGAKAMLLTILGRADEALAAADMAREIDPVSALIKTDHGWFHYYGGDYAAALTSCNEAATLAPENAAIAYCEYKAATAAGDIAAAGKAGARLIDFWRGDEALARDLIDEPSSENIRRFTVWQLELLQKLTIEGNASAEDYAIAYAQNGDLDDAAASLLEAARKHAPLLPLILRDPVFASIHADQRYLGALAEAGLSESGRS